MHAILRRCKNVHELTAGTHVDDAETTHVDDVECIFHGHV